jgi:PPOX class probable F420-dependent enzyme
VDIPASHRDLLEADVATLATIDDDGFPQLTEVWFLPEDGDVKVSINTERAKAANLQARPQCSLLIVDLSNPYRYLELRGRAIVEPDPDYEFATRVGAKSDGADLRRYDGPNASRIVVTIEPVKVYAVDMSD